MSTVFSDQLRFNQRVVWCKSFVSFFAMLLLTFSSLAEAAPSQEDVIKRIENYFSELKTYQADFLQINPDRSLAKGQFFLQRPDKFRLAYNEPKETVLISDGRLFIEYDPRDNIPNFLSLDSTPASILMKKDVKLSGDTTVSEINSFDDIIQVTLYQTEQPDLGAITLVFKEKPFMLVHWIIHDSQGNTTEVSLKNIKQNEKLNQNLFIAPG